MGFPALEALVFVLIFNTAPVAFGALGVPVTVLGAVTGLPATALGAMIGRQLPVMALILPFYVMAIYGGLRSVRALWPVLLVAGGSFAASQFIASNLLDYALTDVLASLGSLIVTLFFLQVWRPAPDPEFRITEAALAQERASPVAPWQGWLPWLIVSALVIVWTHFGWASIGQESVKWPGLHNAISITLYNDKPYAAVWGFQPLGTGTAILLAAIITAAIVRLSPLAFFECVAQTFGQVWLAIITVMLIIGLAYLMNYSGLAYALGHAVASTGYLFVLLSPFLGWVAVMLSGRDASGNALFGNLQVVAARQLDLNPVLFAATNSSGDVIGKIDLAAERRNRRFGDQAQGSGRRGVRAHLHSQHCPDRAAQRPGRVSAVRHSLGHSGRRRLTQTFSSAKENVRPTSVRKRGNVRDPLAGRTPEAICPSRRAPVLAGRLEKTDFLLPNEPIHGLVMTVAEGRAVTPAWGP